MSWLLYDPFSFRVLFIGIGLVLLLLAFFLFRLTRDVKPARRLAPTVPKPVAPVADATSRASEEPVAPGDVIPPTPRPVAEAEPAAKIVQAEPAVPGILVPPAVDAAPEVRASTLPHVAAPPAASGPPAPSLEIPEPATSRGYTFQTLQTRPSFALDMARALLIVLSFVVLACLVIVAVPESTINTLAGRLQPAPTAATTDKLALLYLGEEVKGDEFRIRGVVRNISGDTLERVDATIRIYSHDSVLLETHVARLDIEVIAADGAAQFQLVVPNYTGQIGSYAVEFRTRQQGEPVPFQDARLTQAQN